MENTYYAIGRSGQSLAAGAEGIPIRNAVDRSYFNNFMLGGNVDSGGDGPTTIPPELLFRNLKSVGAETIDMGWALHASSKSRVKLPPTVWFYHGWAGYGLNQMNKGTGCFQKGLDQLKRIVDICEKDNYKVIAPCFDFISGENDSASFSRDWTEKTYYDALLAYRKDINTAFSEITGQKNQIPMIFCQTSSHTFYHQVLGGAGNAYNVDMPTCAIVMARLANDFPGNFIMAGAKYHYTPGGATGTERSSHLGSIGYERLGEKRGQIYLQSIIGNKPWKPLQVKSSRFVSAKVIELSYDLMFAPLQIDTTAVTDPGNKGFSLIGTGGNIASLTIVSVTVATSGKAILIELNQAPTAQVEIAYAWANANSSTYSDPNPPYPGYPLSTGPVRGPRGCVCDSDPTQSLWAHDMRNWAIHQKVRVN